MSDSLTPLFGSRWERSPFVFPMGAKKLYCDLELARVVNDFGFDAIIELPPLLAVPSTVVVLIGCNKEGNAAANDDDGVGDSADDEEDERLGWVGIAATDVLLFEIVFNRVLIFTLI